LTNKNTSSFHIMSSLSVSPHLRESLPARFAGAPGSPAAYPPGTPASIAGDSRADTAGTRAMVEVRGVVKRFEDRQRQVEALGGVDLRINAGEVFGIIGRSGAGKSTLIRCINFLEQPTEGQIIVDGVDLATLTAAELREQRRHIGMIFQHFNLLSSRTVYDNVALPLELAGISKAEIRKRVVPLLELVGLAALADRYPAQISGGQKQRVGIARALAGEPKVLLSDEATSALDPETTRSILALLGEINRKLGLTIILITHQMQVVAEVCDRVAVMEAGRIVETGEVFDVFTHPQAAITRTLVQDVIRAALPEETVRAAQAKAAPGSRLWRITLSGDSAGEPVLTELIRRFHLSVNLLQGHVDEIRGRPFGSLLVLASGPAHELDAAIAHLGQRGVVITPIRDAAVEAAGGENSNVH
jgi:D-methionine transport system ATP-binding protein